jgi:hypothetical protein
MLCNEFITKMLELMSNPIPRLRNPQESLSIQIELQNNYVNNLIKYFIMLMPEYKYNWNILQTMENRGEIYNNFTSIENNYEFQEFRLYLLAQNLFNYNEIDWIEDAIHEILVE